MPRLVSLKGVELGEDAASSLFLAEGLASAYVLSRRPQLVEGEHILCGQPRISQIGA